MDKSMVSHFFGSQCSSHLKSELNSARIPGSCLWVWSTSATVWCWRVQGVPSVDTPLCPFWGKHPIQGPGLQSCRRQRDTFKLFSFKTSKLKPSLLSLSGYGTGLYITYTSAECSLGNQRQIVHLMSGIVGYGPQDVAGIITRLWGRGNASGVP